MRVQEMTECSGAVPASQQPWAASEGNAPTGRLAPENTLRFTAPIRERSRPRTERHHPMSTSAECRICLGRFSRPAALPCQHVFCLACIGEYWRARGACQCPLCMTLFPTRPPLQTHRTPGAGAPAEEAQTAPKAWEVPCDFCPERRRAVKSCLVCLASYCDAHLEPHYLEEELGRHVLVGVLKNLEDSVCRLHGQPLDRFCRSDRACVCAMCANTDHRGHRVVSVDKEATNKKIKLKKRRLKLERALQERLSEAETLGISVGPAGENLRDSRAQRKELLGGLEEEISELRRRKLELEQLCQTEDSLRFLQRFLHTALRS